RKVCGCGWTGDERPDCGSACGPVYVNTRNTLGPVEAVPVGGRRAVSGAGVGARVPVELKDGNRGNKRTLGNEHHADAGQREEHTTCKQNVFAFSKTHKLKFLCS